MHWWGQKGKCKDFCRSFQLWVWKCGSLSDEPWNWLNWFFPPFCRTVRAFWFKSGWKCCGNSFSGGILVFPLLLTPRPGSAEAQPSAHCVQVSFYKCEFSFLLPHSFFFFFPNSPYKGLISLRFRLRDLLNLFTYLYQALNCSLINDYHVSLNHLNAIFPPQLSMPPDSCASVPQQLFLCFCCHSLPYLQQDEVCLDMNIYLSSCQ